MSLGYIWNIRNETTTWWPKHLVTTFWCNILAVSKHFYVYLHITCFFCLNWLLIAKQRAVNSHEATTSKNVTNFSWGHWVSPQKMLISGLPICRTCHWMNYIPLSSSHTSWGERCLDGMFLGVQSYLLTFGVWKPRDIDQKSQKYLLTWLFLANFMADRKWGDFLVE